MNACLRITFVSLWLICASHILAQPPVGVYIPIFNNAVPGSFISLPVRVIHFDSIASVQFVIRWDTTILRYKSVNSLNLPGMNGQSFNTIHALDSGLLRFAWEAPNSFPGTTVLDSTIIFRIKFDVQGPLLSGSSVYFTESFPTFFEITKVHADSSLEAININQASIHQGFVAVGYTVSSTEPPSEHVLPADIFPNPFSNDAQLRFELEHSGEVQITIHDMSGRLCYENNLGVQAAGKHSLSLTPHLFKESNLYLLTIRSGEQQNVLRIVKQ
ncbi:MAG: T9SS type A sorting domain-containing protein [Bacteroidota bacterium]